MILDGARARGETYLPPRALLRRCGPFKTGGGDTIYWCENTAGAHARSWEVPDDPYPVPEAHRDLRRGADARHAREHGRRARRRRLQRGQPRVAHVLGAADHAHRADAGRTDPTQHHAAVVAAALRAACHAARLLRPWPARW